MTKLEEEIWNTLPPEVMSMGNSAHFVTRCAAEVAKKYIKRAFAAGVDAMDGGQTVISEKEWLKENGITE